MNEKEKEDKKEQRRKRKSISINYIDSSPVSSLMDNEVLRRVKSFTLYHRVKRPITSSAALNAPITMKINGRKGRINSSIIHSTAYEGEMHPSFVLNSRTNYSSVHSESRSNIYHHSPCVSDANTRTRANIMMHVAHKKSLINKFIKRNGKITSSTCQQADNIDCTTYDESNRENNLNLTSSVNESIMKKHLDKLHVKSHLTIFNGVTYIEDSDWEIYSDSEVSIPRNTLSPHISTTNARIFRSKHKIIKSPWSSMSSLNTSSTPFSIDQSGDTTNETTCTLLPATSTESSSTSYAREVKASSSIDHVLTSEEKLSSLSDDTTVTFDTHVYHPKSRVSSNVENVDTQTDSTDEFMSTSLGLTTSNSMDGMIMSHRRKDERCSSAPAVLFNESVECKEQIHSCVNLLTHESTDTQFIDKERQTKRALSSHGEINVTVKHGQIRRQHFQPLVHTLPINDYSSSLTRHIDPLMKDISNELIESNMQDIMKGKLLHYDICMTRECVEETAEAQLIGTFNCTSQSKRRRRRKKRKKETLRERSGIQIFGHKNDSTFPRTGTLKVTLTCNESNSVDVEVAATTTAAAAAADADAGSTSSSSSDDQYTPTREMKIMSEKLNKQKANNHKRTHVLNFESKGGKAHLQVKLNNEWTHLCLKEISLHENEEEGNDEKVDEKNQVKVHNEIIQHTFHKPHAHDTLTLPLHLIELFENYFIPLDSSREQHSPNTSSHQLRSSLHRYHSESCSPHDNTFQLSSHLSSCCYCYCQFCYTECITSYSIDTSQLDGQEKHLSYQHFTSQVDKDKRTFQSETASKCPVIIVHYIHPCILREIVHSQHTKTSRDIVAICIKSKSESSQCILHYYTIDQVHQRQNIANTKEYTYHAISCFNSPGHLSIDLNVQFNLNTHSKSVSQMQGESHRILLKLGPRLVNGTEAQAQDDQVHAAIGKVTPQHTTNDAALASLSSPSSFQNHLPQNIPNENKLNSNFKLQRSVTKIHISQPMSLESQRSDGSVKKSSSSPSLLSSYNQHMIHVQVKHRCSNRVTTSYAPLASLPRKYFRPQSVNCIFTSPPAVPASTSPVCSLLLPVSSNNRPSSHTPCNDICIGNSSYLHSSPHLQMTKQNNTHDTVNGDFSSFTYNAQAKSTIDNPIRSTTPDWSAKAQQFTCLMNRFDQIVNDVNNDPDNVLTLLDDHGNEETIWTRHSRKKIPSHLSSNTLKRDQPPQQQNTLDQSTGARVDYNETNKSHSLPRNHYQRRQRQPDSTQQCSPSDACLSVCQETLPPGEKKYYFTRCHEITTRNITAPAPAAAAVVVVAADVTSQTMRERDSHDSQTVNNDAFTQSMKEKVEKIATVIPSVTMHRNQQGHMHGEYQENHECNRIHPGVDGENLSKTDWQTNYTYNSFTLPLRGANSKCESRNTAQCTPPRVNNEFTILTNSNNNSHTSQAVCFCCTADLGHRCHTSQRRHSNEGQNNGLHSPLPSSSSLRLPHRDDVSIYDDEDKKTDTSGTLLEVHSSQDNSKNSCEDEKQQDREEEEIHETIWQIDKCNTSHLSRGKLVSNALMLLNNQRVNCNQDAMKSHPVPDSINSINERQNNSLFASEIDTQDVTSECESDHQCYNNSYQRDKMSLMPAHRQNDVTTDEIVSEERKNGKKENTLSPGHINSPLCYDASPNDTNEMKDNIQAQGECEDIVHDDTVVCESQAGKVGDNDKGENDKQNECDTSHMHMKSKRNDRDEENEEEMQLCDQQERAEERNEYPVRQEKEEVSGRLVTELTMHLTGRNAVAVAAAASDDTQHREREQLQYEQQCNEKTRLHQCQLRRQHSPANEIHSLNEVNSDCLQLTDERTNCSHDSDASVTQQQHNQHQQQQLQKQQQRQGEEEVKKEQHLQSYEKQQDQVNIYHTQPNQPFNLPSTLTKDKLSEKYCYLSYVNENNSNDQESVNNTNYQAIVTEVTSDTIWHKRHTPAHGISSSFFSSSSPATTAVPVDSPCTSASASSSSCSCSSGFASDLTAGETKQIVPSVDSVSPRQSSSSPHGHRRLTPSTGDFVSDQSSESISLSCYSYCHPVSSYCTNTAHHREPEKKENKSQVIQFTTPTDDDSTTTDVLSCVTHHPHESDKSAIVDEKITAEPTSHRYQRRSPSLIIQFSNLLSKQIVSSILGSFPSKSNQEKQQSRLFSLQNWLPEDNSSAPVSLTTTNDLQLTPKRPPRSHRKDRKQSRDFVNHAQYPSPLGVVASVASSCNESNQGNVFPSSTASVKVTTSVEPDSQVDTVVKETRSSSSRDTVITSRECIECSSNAETSSPVFTDTFSTLGLMSLMPASDKATQSSRESLGTGLNKQSAASTADVTDASSSSSTVSSSPLSSQCNTSSALCDTFMSTCKYLDTQSAFNSSLTSRVQQKTSEKENTPSRVSETLSGKKNNQSHETSTDVSGASVSPFSEDDEDDDDDDGDSEDPVLVDLCQEESGQYCCERATSPSHHQFNLYYTDIEASNRQTIDMHPDESISECTFDDLTDYGNPFSYSLHTIVEESERSCDEGDDCDTKRYSLCSTSPSPNRPLNPAPIAVESTDVSSDEIFKVAKRISNSLSESLQGSDIETSSNSESDCESNAQSSVKCNINSCKLVNKSSSKRHSSHQHHKNNHLSNKCTEDNIDPVIVTSSRLEEYFTFALLSDVESSHIKGSPANVKPRGQPTVQRVVTVNQFNDSNSHFNNESPSTQLNAKNICIESDEIINNKLHSSSSSNDLNNSASPASSSSSSSCDLENNSSSCRTQLSQSPKVIQCISVNKSTGNNEQSVEHEEFLENKKVTKEEQVKVEKEKEENKIYESLVKEEESNIKQVNLALTMKPEEQVDQVEDKNIDTDNICSTINKFPREKESNVDTDEDETAGKVDLIECTVKSSTSGVSTDDVDCDAERPVYPEEKIINSHLQSDVNQVKQEIQRKTGSLKMNESLKPEKSICMLSQCKVKCIPTICQVNLVTSHASSTLPSSSSFSSTASALTPSTLVPSPASSQPTAHDTVNPVTMTNASITSRTHAVSQAFESHCRNIISGASDVWKKFKGKRENFSSLVTSQRDTRAVERMFCRQR